MRDQGNSKETKQPSFQGGQEADAEAVAPSTFAALEVQTALAYEAGHTPVETGYKTGFAWRERPGCVRE